MLIICCNLSLQLRYFILLWYEGMCLNILELDVPCLVDIPGRPVLFLKKMEKEWIWERGEWGEGLEEEQKGEIHKEI